MDRHASKRYSTNPYGYAGKGGVQRRGPATQSTENLIVGSTQLYDSNGSIKYVPMPTPDPKDPLNLPRWRKMAIVGVLCFFGALAQSSEAIIGSLLPVFMLEYNGINPKVLGKMDLSKLGTSGQDPSVLMEHLPGPSYEQVSLLSTVPLLVNGVAAWILVPTSIAIGRRPVMLLAGLLAWTGALWAGGSQSLTSHIAARCFQGLGAGTIDSLIPLILQDVLFIHERNRAVAAIHASSGLIIVCLGVASPIMVVTVGWRWVYGVAAIATFTSWIGILLLMPETRWVRSPEELAGDQLFELKPGCNRPEINEGYGKRTKWTDFGVFNTQIEGRLALESVWLSIKTLKFPNVIWCIMLNAMLTGTHTAISQVASSLLIGAGWEFTKLGLAVLPVVIASPFVWFVGGFGADKVSNWMARRNGGQREPESHLLSMVLPIIVGFIGPLVFGYAATNIDSLPSEILLIGSGFLSFSSLSVQTLVSTYLVESYPYFAGPVLVTASTFRLIVGFAFSVNVTSWIKAIGFFSSFGIYSVLICTMAFLLPLIYCFGRRIRNWSAGRLEDTANKKKKQEDIEMTESPTSKTKNSHWEEDEYPLYHNLSTTTTRDDAWTHEDSGRNGAHMPSAAVQYQAMRREQEQKRQLQVNKPLPPVEKHSYIPYRPAPRPAVATTPSSSTTRNIHVNIGNPI